VTRHKKSDLPALKPAELPSVSRVKAKLARMFMPTEHAIQSGFISGCRIMEAQYPDLALGFAVPNGGYRTPTTAAKLQAEGVRPGVPDWMLPVARGGHIGLAIEFKRPDGELSKAQREYLPRLAGAGWKVAIHTDASEALLEALLYLRG
jgi:hypothetical protein